jgi:hypothetical protein
MSLMSKTVKLKGPTNEVSFSIFLIEIGSVPYIIGVLFSILDSNSIQN